MQEKDGKYIIQEDYTIREALSILNDLPDSILTLLVIDHRGTMLGTVTDGDIRRGLISGCSLEDPISKLMNSSFYYLMENKIDLLYIKEAKQKGIALLPILNAKKNILSVLNIRKKKSLLPIDAVLMAGGKGERLRPLTEKTPKPLLKVGDKPIIDYNIDNLLEYGLNNIFVTINYLKEQLIQHFRQPREGIQIQCVEEPRFLGTIGSVQYVKDIKNDTVLIMNSDLFTNIDYEDFYMYHIDNKADVSVLSIPYSHKVPFGVFDIEGCEIKGLREKPTFNHYANGGIYLIKRELLDNIPKDTFFDATDFIEMMINKGHKVIRYPLMGYWIDIGKFEDYYKALELVKHTTK